MKNNPAPPKKTTLTIRIPDEIVKAIDKRVDGVTIRSRAHLITLILRESLRKWAKFEADEKAFFDDDLSNNFFLGNLNQPLPKKKRSQHAFKNKTR